VSRAKAELDAAMVVLESFEGFHGALDAKKLILAPFCGEIPCEDNIKKDSARYININHD
jgi:bifunctional glutamyl/prolyl-tRNA synthetase